MNNEGIFEISNENIIMSFDINNQKYVAFSENVNADNCDVLFAKEVQINGFNVLKNIDSKEEFSVVLNEFNKRIDLISD